MARSDARNVNPSLSSDPRDKLLAALNWSYGKLKHSDPYDRAPMYRSTSVREGWAVRFLPRQNAPACQAPPIYRVGFVASLDNGPD